MQELLNPVSGVREWDVERSRMKMPIEIMPVHVNLEGDVQRVLILPKMIFKLTIFVKACIIEDSSFDASRDKRCLPDQSI